MNDPTTIMHVQELVDADDREAVREQFRRHPELVHAKTLGSEVTFLHYAAIEERPELVRYFFELGIPLNTTNEHMECPLSAIIQMGDFECTKWMLDNDADPNISAWPMVCAIARGRLDIVKLLIEHGADYNAVFFHPPKTALSHAIEFCREDIVEHLRSLHAIMPAGQSRE